VTGLASRPTSRDCDIFGPKIATGIGWGRRSFDRRRRLVRTRRVIGGCFTISGFERGRSLSLAYSERQLPEKSRELFTYHPNGCKMAILPPAGQPTPRWGLIQPGRDRPTHGHSYRYFSALSGRVSAPNYNLPTRSTQLRSLGSTGERSYAAGAGYLHDSLAAMIPGRMRVYSTGTDPERAND